MNQVRAEVISNQRILKELERSLIGSPERPKARNISGSWIIMLQCPEIAREACPGQFVMVRCGEDCVLPRPFSIHQLDNDNIALFFAVWEDGKGTNWLSRRKIGDKVDIFGPLGNGFSIKPTSHNLLLIAGGTGIAPLYFLAQEAVNRGLSVTLLRGASGEFKLAGKPNPPQHYPEELLPRGINTTIISSTADGRRGMVTDLLTPEVIKWADQIFACGPLAMYRDILIRKKQFKGKPVQVSLEVVMGCGLGVCYGCTVKTRQGLKQVCRDGPIFDINDIMWDDWLT
jgi:dihydroorotate dehydrogenase electron transfer subunit